MQALQATSAVRGFQTSISKPLSVVSEGILAHSPAPTSVVVAASSGFLSSGSKLSLSSFSSSASSRRVWSIGGSARAPRAAKVVGGRANQAVCMAAATAPVEVLVKAAVGHPDQLGDCPFSQRVLLTLVEKGIPYDATYIDTSNKPDWFLEASPEETVPVIKDDGKWVADSDVITEILEKKFPDPPLAAPPTPAGGKVYGAFAGFLTSKDPSDGKEEALVAELKELDSHLEEHGPYLNGEKVSALDLALAPKLYHVKIALGHYKNWSIPADLTSLNKYIEAVHSRESFVKTKAEERFVVKGWEKKVRGV